MFKLFNFGFRLGSLLIAFITASTSSLTPSCLESALTAIPAKGPPSAVAIPGAKPLTIPIRSSIFCSVNIYVASRFDPPAASTGLAVNHPDYLYTHGLVGHWHGIDNHVTSADYGKKVYDIEHSLKAPVGYRPHQYGDKNYTTQNRNSNQDAVDIRPQGFFTFNRSQHGGSGFCIALMLGIGLKL
jgi:hypothetical protein